jgi:hypothetical protein
MGYAVFIMAPIYSCANPECVGIRNLEKPGDMLDDAAKCTAHTFLLYQPESYSCIELPFQGIYQGNGAGPGIWLLVSITAQ